MVCTGTAVGFSLWEFCNEDAMGPHPLGKNILEDAAGGLTCLKTSEFQVKCITDFFWIGYFSLLNFLNFFFRCRLLQILTRIHFVNRRVSVD